MPFHGRAKAGTQNSESRFRCWFIEEPTQRSLDKAVTIRLAPHDHFDLIVVIKTPQKPSHCELLSKLRIKHLVEGRGEEEVREKRVSRDSIVSENTMAVQRETSVLLLGKLEDPVLTCLKSIRNEKVGHTVIPIAVKKYQTL